MIVVRTCPRVSLLLRMNFAGWRSIRLHLISVPALNEKSFSFHTEPLSSMK